MKLATLLVIAVSHQGYWFGGEPATIAARLAIKELPAADLVWELRLDGIVLAGKAVPVAGDDKETVIHLIPPEVRDRVTFHWLYRVVDRNTKKELGNGDIPLYVFPDDLWGGLGRRLGNRRLVICDKPQGLTKLLESAAVPHTELELGKLEFARADDIVLVGPDALTGSPFEQDPLMNLARAGASVMVFRQSEPGVLFGYPLANRAAPANAGNFRWRMDHPLLAGFEPQDLRSWIAGASSLAVIQLPPDEPALAIGFYPGEVSGDEPKSPGLRPRNGPALSPPNGPAPSPPNGPALSPPNGPVDAVFLTRSVGSGRIVLCQIQLGDWKDDPRTQMLLRNAIDYLLTRPQPTPRPSERAPARHGEKRPNRTVLFSPAR